MSTDRLTYLVVRRILMSQHLVLQNFEVRSTRHNNTHVRHPCTLSATLTPAANTALTATD